MAGQTTAPRPDASLLLISVDGLRHDYLTEADKHGLQIPHLRKLWREGAHASSVRGALPTATYPSHTTIVTGTSPARHGIAANAPFDPTGQAKGFHWYAEELKVPALWDAAAAAGYEVGSVSWPVTVGAQAIKYNIPDFAAMRSDEDAKMIRAWAGREFMENLARKAGPFITDINTGTIRDWARTRYVAEIIRQNSPRVILAHFVAMDHFQHRHGPFTPQAHAALEEIDRMIGELVAAMRGQYPRTAVCVVSDHGFSAANQSLALDAAFVEAGLITLKSKQRTLEAAGLQDWIAMPWKSGGSAAIMLKNPADAEARIRTRTVLDQLAADPANGIAGIIDRIAISRLGGTEAAEFWVDLKPGYTFSGMLGGSLVLPAGKGGTHGYVPTHPEMGSVFLLAGPGIQLGDLGEIDMRRIAPTLAAFLGVPFPTAEMPALDLFSTARP
jgi:predicted AlkP superfamily pyrophosphatase or phosphodiesterase